MWEYNYDCELYHHGILGMKWGIRRFQNKNGSLTSAGKRRRMSQDAREAAKLKKKKVYEMSNAELKKLNERQNLEKNHRNLNPTTIAKGVLYVAALGTFMDNSIKLSKNIPKAAKGIANTYRKVKTKVIK